MTEYTRSTDTIADRLMEKQLHTERGNVYYWIHMEGKQDAIVFLHGLTADHRLFERQVPHFAAKYNIIVWDAPAHGKSRPYTDFTYPNAAEDLKRILDENRIASAILIGQSMGGYMIQSFLLRYPQRVKAFVGIDTCPYGESYYSSSDKWMLRQVGWMSELYPQSLLKSAIAAQVSVTEYARQSMAEMLKLYSKAELCRLMGIGFAGFLADNRDMDIHCPVLILAGEKDKTGKVLHYCDQWAEKTGWCYQKIANAAHNANADNPEAVNAAIDDFLQTFK